MSSENISINRGIFSSGSNFRERYISDYKRLAQLVEHCRGLGLKIVLTQGTYDMVHIGHARYFETAKKHGDILIVGVDSDEKVRNRKGPERPVVPEEERLEMVAHLRPVDVVVLKPLKAPKWQLIKMIRPDTLIATKTTYNRAQIKKLKKWCKEVVILDPMATTSTSAKIRKLQISTAKSLGMALTPKIMDTIEEVLNNLKNQD
ncbi:MAG TPA: adenylyltransferase/cytidyltransferase family protein [Candidatus Paceibacterota bacterium]|nr:adenylyltransferase/cytidyltransferase family protein [Candidatus Paceibacterota bacterium]